MRRFLSKLNALRGDSPITLNSNEKATLLKSNKNNSLYLHPQLISHLNEGSSDKETVVIIGSGIIGASSAYYLTKSGKRRVILLDKHNEPGQETSYSSGSTLAVNKLSSWNNPDDNYYRLLKGVFTKTTPKFHWKLLKEKYCVTWFYNAWRLSSKSHYKYTFKRNTDLGILSLNLLRDLDADIPISKLDSYEKYQYIFYNSDSQKDRDSALKKAAETKTYTNYNYQYLSTSEFKKKEPAFAYLQGENGFVIKTENDSNVDSLKLTNGLVNFCREKHPKTFSFIGGFELDNWVVDEKGKIIGIKGKDGGVLLADKFVVAGGWWTKEIVAKLGVKVPLLAAKGHALTIKAPKDRPRAEGMIFSMDYLVMGTQLGDRIRMSGLVDFMGIDRNLMEDRMERLRSFSRRFYGIDPKDGEFWTGFRPVSPDDMPIISQVCEKEYPNVYVNTGHGSKGISWGLGSGKFLSSLIDEEKLEKLDRKDFELSRFSFI